MARRRQLDIEEAELKAKLDRLEARIAAKTKGQ